MSRRVALGYRNRTDFANSLQFTVRTLSDIENGVRKASPGTYAMLENKLGWAPGSIDTILTAENPKSWWSSCAPPRPPLAPMPTPLKRYPSIALPPPRNCCWSCAAASSGPATDATTPGTTGAMALTRKASWPEER